MDKKDFTVTENYNLRLRGLGGKKVANEFSNMLNKPLNYADKQTTWGSILLLKARELAHNLIGKSKELDFVSPEFGAKRVDSHEIVQNILIIFYADWKKLGFSTWTLHYVKPKVKSDKSFTLSAHVLDRVKKWEALVSS